MKVFYFLYGSTCISKTFYFAQVVIIDIVTMNEVVVVRHYTNLAYDINYYPELLF